MEITEEYKEKNSITYEVIRYVTVFYFSIAILLTIFQVIIEYFNIKRSINVNISEIQENFKESLTNSLWELNDTQIQAILEGIQKSPSILAVSVSDSSNNKTFESSFIKNLQKNPSYNKPGDKNALSKLISPTSLFTYEIDLVKVIDINRSEKIGKLYIYSGNKIILDLLSHIIFSIITTSVITTISLWVILIIFINRKLKKPFDDFVESITNADPRDPMPITDDISGGISEFFKIQQAFNKMINELKNFKDVLEAIVDNKTELLKVKNIEMSKLIHKLESAKDKIIHQEKLSSLGMMSAGIAHELKNPLNLSKNTALMAKELLLEDFDSENVSEETKEFIQKIVHLTDVILQSNARMAGIINNMLLQSRADDKVLAKINLKKFVETNLRVVQKSLKDKASERCQLVFDISDEFDLQVYPNEFGRMLVNLFENAFHAMQFKLSLDDDFQPKLIITGKSLGINKILLSIHDNGIGIEKSIIDKVLNPFFTTKASGQGTGLGLYLAFEIVKEHKGEFTINTEDKIYTEIQIELPTNLS